MDLHPLQDEADAQGVLGLIYDLERMIAEISGMHSVSLHTSGGSTAIWTNIAMIRAFHESNGEGEQRNEVITTIFSHPSAPYLTVPNWLSSPSTPMQRAIPTPTPSVP